jgi:hypothetical protein
VLENLPEPECALDEMLRVAREEAIIYLDPAYNCRSYTVKKLEVRHLNNLSLLENLKNYQFLYWIIWLFEQLSLYLGECIWKVCIFLARGISDLSIENLCLTLT